MVKKVNWPCKHTWLIMVPYQQLLAVCVNQVSISQSLIQSYNGKRNIHLHMWGTFCGLFEAESMAGNHCHGRIVSLKVIIKKELSKHMEKKAADQKSLSVSHI